MVGYCTVCDLLAIVHFLWELVRFFQVIYVNRSIKTKEAQFPDLSKRQNLGCDETADGAGESDLAAAEYTMTQNGLTRKTLIVPATSG